MTAHGGRHAPRRDADAGDGPRRPGRGIGRWVVVAGLSVATAVALTVLPGSPAPDRVSTLDRVLAERAETRDGSDGPQLPTRDDIATLRGTVEDAVLAASYDNPIDAETASTVLTRPGPYTEMGTIAIPAIDLDVVYGNGVNESVLEKGPGHWPGTPAPGQPGNAVLSGHRNTHTQPFKELDVLEPGDEIIASTGSGPETTYVVVDTVIVPEEEYTDYVLAQPDDPDVRQITVFACHPEGNPVNRIIVQAVAADGART